MFFYFRFLVTGGFFFPASVGHFSQSPPSAYPVLSVVARSGELRRGGGGRTGLPGVAANTQISAPSLAKPCLACSRSSPGQRGRVMVLAGENRLSFTPPELGLLAQSSCRARRIPLRKGRRRSHCRTTSLPVVPFRCPYTKPRLSERRQARLPAVSTRSAARQKVTGLC